MKAIKITISFIAAVLVCLAVAVLPRKLAFEGAKKYTFFLGDTSKNCRTVSVNSHPEITRLTLKDVCGEAAEYDSLNVDEFLKSVNGKILFCENLSDSVNYYCSADLPYSLTLNGQKINLHVCVKESGVTVASPIIFGGY